MAAPSLPYPAGSDLPDIPADMQKLADGMLALADYTSGDSAHQAGLLDEHLTVIEDDLLALSGRVTAAEGQLSVIDSQRQGLDKRLVTLRDYQTGPQKKAIDALNTEQAWQTKANTDLDHQIGGDVKWYYRDWTDVYYQQPVNCGYIDIPIQGYSVYRWTATATIRDDFGSEMQSVLRMFAFPASNAWMWDTDIYGELTYMLPANGFNKSFTLEGVIAFPDDASAGKTFRFMIGATGSSITGGAIGGHLSQLFCFTVERAYGFGRPS